MNCRQPPPSYASEIHLRGGNTPLPASSKRCRRGTSYDDGASSGRGKGKRAGAQRNRSTTALSGGKGGDYVSGSDDDVVGLRRPPKQLVVGAPDSGWLELLVRDTLRTPSPLDDGGLNGLSPITAARLPSFSSPVSSSPSPGHLTQLAAERRRRGAIDRGAGERSWTRRAVCKMCLAVVLMLNNFYKHYDALLEYCEHVTAAILLCVFVALMFLPIFLTVKADSSANGAPKQPLVTITVLVIGVVGGLFMVIAFVFFCKNCFKKRAPITTQPARRAGESIYNSIIGPTDPVPTDYCGSYLPQPIVTPPHSDNNNSVLAPDFSFIVDMQKQQKQETAGHPTSIKPGNIVVVNDPDDLHLVVETEDVDESEEQGVVVQAIPVSLDGEFSHQADGLMFPRCAGTRPSERSLTIDDETRVPVVHQEFDVVADTRDLLQIDDPYGRRRLHSDSEAYALQPIHTVTTEQSRAVSQSSAEGVIKGRSFDDRLRPGTGRKLPPTAAVSVERMTTMNEANNYYAHRYDEKYGPDRKFTSGGLGPRRRSFDRDPTDGGDFGRRNVGGDKRHMVVTGGYPLVRRTLPSPVGSGAVVAPPVSSPVARPLAHLPRSHQVVVEKTSPPPSTANWNVVGSPPPPPPIGVRSPDAPYYNSLREDFPTPKYPPQPIAYSRGHHNAMTWDANSDRNERTNTVTERDALQEFSRQIRTMFPSPPLEVVTNVAVSAGYPTSVVDPGVAGAAAAHFYNSMAMLDATGRPMKVRSLGSRDEDGLKAPVTGGGRSFDSCVDCRNDEMRRVSGATMVLQGIHKAGSKQFVGLQRQQPVDDIECSVVGSGGGEQQVKIACKMLWGLRSTLEETTVSDDDEEEEGVAQKRIRETAIDGSGSSGGPEGGNGVALGLASFDDPPSGEGSYTTSFESNTEPLQSAVTTEYLKQHRPSRPYLEPPKLSSEARRQKYRNLFARRQWELHQNATEGSFENSFDSFGTRSSESSYPGGMAPASFESNFSNQGEGSDSTVDSQGRKKIAELKGDSGYKSQSTDVQQQQQAAASTSGLQWAPPPPCPTILTTAPYLYTDAVTGETTSGESRSGESIDYGDYSVVPANVHVARMRQKHEGKLNRDFSIDSKTDSLFREFVRADPKLKRGWAHTKYYSSDGGHPSPPPPSQPSTSFVSSVADHFYPIGGDAARFHHAFTANDGGVPPMIPVIRLPEEQDVSS